ncbi:MAG: hypothetical protein JEY99_20705 [Spirochaetales bacterium]|nr:hypothetical protein [Spirochaetales bacterium]
MKKIVFLIICLSLLTPLFAQVDKSELESANYGGVEFRSYQGPHTIIDSLADIRDIGIFLAGASLTGRKEYFDKYTMIHEFDADEDTLFCGDILILNDQAGVDHIDNLRHILAAYLEKAYDYASDDALVLARFITFYNAVYRGNIDYFNGKYIPAVLSHLTKEKVGIDVEYTQWPGKTQLVIPISPPGRAGTGSVLDTDALTEDAVIESLRDDEGMNLEVRKEMTEIKEEEIQEEEAAIEEARTVIQEKEEEIDQEREEIASRENALEEKDQTDPEVEKQIEEIEEDKDVLAEKVAELEADKEELQEREEQQEERLEQIREERELIAADEQTVMEEGSSPVKKTVNKDEFSEVPFLVLSVNPLDPGSLALIRVDSGNTETSSSMTDVHGGRFYEFAGGYLVIAGEESGNRIISFALLDKETLELSVSASEPVSPFTKVLIDGDSAYAAVRMDGKWVPGRFDFELNLIGFVDDSILPHSNFVVKDGYLIYQDLRARVKSVAVEDMKTP